MIKSLSIEGFQSHKNSYIEFSPEVNIIKGENDSGKSSILRAINFIVNNRPSGDEFRSTWGGDTNVAIDVDDKLVSRIRTDKENIYALTHANGEEDIFKAFGKGVPEQIQQHLNMSFINLAFQLDGPFLLQSSYSAADVAKFYNKIVNLDVIDTTIANIASTLRKERSALSAEKQTKEKKEEELKDYDRIIDVEADVVKLEKLDKDIGQLKNDSGILTGLIYEFEELEITNQKLDEVVKFENQLLALVSSSKEIQELKNTKLELESLARRLELLNENDQKLNEIVNYRDEVNSLVGQSEEINAAVENENILAKYIDDLEKLLEAKNRCSVVIGYTNQVKALLVLDGEVERGMALYNALDELLSKRQSLSQRHKDIEIQLADLENKFKKAMPSKCPIFDVKCNQTKEGKE